MVLKHRHSAFYNTDLDTVVRCLGAKDLVIAGVMTNLCCESTARDARRSQGIRGGESPASPPWHR